MSEPAVAAVDCGTNSTRLLVVGAAGETVAREMRITRLGAGVDATRRLQPAAIARTIEVLAEYRSIMDAARVTRARLVATSAVRDAANGAAFLEPAAAAVGVPGELLSGVEEGRLSYAGATAELPPVDGHTVVVDIGGGSTEIVTMVEEVIAAVSLDIGCVRLTERFLRDDPPSPAQVVGAVGEITRELERAVRDVPALATLGARDRLVGLAGTVSTLAALELGLTEYDRGRIHHSVLSADAVKKWCEVLGSEQAAARAERAAIPAGRVDVIFGGALVLRECMSRFGVPECTVSESDILDGIVQSLRPGPAIG